MAYFLKKSNLSNGTYLQIHESFYNPDKKQTAHRSIKPIGYIDDLIASGLKDPISFYKAEVDKMNDERNADSVKKIGSSSAIRYLGYFPLQAILNQLNIAKYIDFLHLANDFSFKLSDILYSLILPELLILVVNIVLYMKYFLAYFVSIIFLMIDF